MIEQFIDKYIYYIYIYNACSSHVGSTDDALLLGSSKRAAGRSSMADGDACDVWGDWVGDTYAYACLVETDVEAALVHGHFQLLFVILVATQRLALERER